MATKIDWSHRDEHTKRKHDILDEYVRAWIVATAGSTKYPFPKLYVVDCFAGRGKYINGELGSPMILMKALEEKLETYNCNAECFFIEKIPLTHDTLYETVHSLQTPKVSAKCFRGTFDRKIKEVFAAIKQTQMPIFFFVDPTGYKSVPGETLRSLSQYKKAEILLNVQSAGIIRNEPGLSEQMALVNLEAFLREQCNFKFVLPYPVSFDEIRRNMYYLVYATRNKTGHKIMKEIQDKYHYGYKGPVEELEATQYTLIDDLNIQTVKRFLLENYKSGVIVPKTELEHAILERLKGCVTKHLTGALKQLEQEGKITREQGLIKFH